MGGMSVVAKSHGVDVDKKLSLHDETWMTELDFHPHLLYANLQLDSDKESREQKRLIDWCQLQGPDWSRMRILKYLASHQSQFRNCLRWLIADAVVDFWEFRKELGRNSKYVLESDLLHEWRKAPDASFLQLHGVSHSDVSLRPQIGPSASGEWLFSGIDLGPQNPKDPIDVICWHLLYLLMRDGDLNIRECKGCETFFRPRTKRKYYCSDLCRAKAHAKNPEEWRGYMRKYRAVKKHLEKVSMRKP
jgi:hypothetical protein